MNPHKLAALLYFATCSIGANLLCSVIDITLSVFLSVLSAIDGGVSVWKILSEKNTYFKDHEFCGHHGRMLERMMESGKGEWTSWSSC